MDCFIAEVYWERTWDNTIQSNSLKHVTTKFLLMIVNLAIVNLVIVNVLTLSYRCVVNLLTIFQHEPSKFLLITPTPSYTYTTTITLI